MWRTRPGGRERKPKKEIRKNNETEKPQINPPCLRVFLVFWCLKTANHVQKKRARERDHAEDRGEIKRKEKKLEKES